MKNLLLAVFAVFTLVGLSSEKAMNFPVLDGFEKDGDVEVYNEANLYEYINGAADGYIQAGFKMLYVQIYTKNEDASFTIDVYEMKDAPSGFGIFKKEKSAGEKIAAGAEGYYEKGMLNFHKGKYYVKLSSYGLGDQDRSILGNAAELMSGLLVAEKKKTLFDCFPAENRVADSEQYIGSDFLGHGFLSSAYTVKLKVGETEINPFIIKANSAENISTMLEQYKALLKRKNKTVSVENDVMSFFDPYYRNVGKMYLFQENNLLIGLFSKDADQALKMIQIINSNIKENMK